MCSTRGCKRRSWIRDGITDRLFCRYHFDLLISRRFGGRKKRTQYYLED